MFRHVLTQSALIERKGRLFRLYGEHHDIGMLIFAVLSADSMPLPPASFAFGDLEGVRFGVSEPLVIELRSPRDGRPSSNGEEGPDSYFIGA